MGQAVMVAEAQGKAQHQESSFDLVMFSCSTYLVFSWFGLHYAMFGAAVLPSYALIHSPRLTKAMANEAVCDKFKC